MWNVLRRVGFDCDIVENVCWWYVSNIACQRKQILCRDCAFDTVPEKTQLFHQAVQEFKNVVESIAVT